MREAEIVAWILYAVAGASGQGPADFRGISLVADGINHAVPNHKELQTSLRWLCHAGLIVSSAQGYTLTSKGAALIKNAGQKSNTIMGVWKELTHQVEQLRIVNAIV
jgi:predicted transcriptional regulator